MKTNKLLSILAVLTCLLSCSSDEPEISNQNNVLGGEYYTPDTRFESMKKIDENTFVFHNQYESTDSVKLVGFDYTNKENRQAFSKFAELPCENGTYSWVSGGQQVFSIQQTKPSEFIVKFSDDAKKLNPNCTRYTFEYSKMQNGTRFVIFCTFYPLETGWNPEGAMFDEDTISSAELEEYFTKYK